MYMFGLACAKLLYALCCAICKAYGIDVVQEIRARYTRSVFT